MSAARVTANTPLAEAVALIEADPISLEIMWSRLVNVVEEMWLTVCRTAFSLVISEAQDFACELLDAHGEPLAHSPRAMPVFNLTLPRAVKALLAKHPPETLKPGDILVTNDPWLCAGHLFDIAIVTPVFREGRLVALMGTVGHVSDIGGTRDWLAAREVYEEGLQIPPMKYAREGVRDETFQTLFAENVRNPAQVLGDVESFVAANATGAERLLAFMRDYGMHDLAALAHVVQSRAEKAMRDAIRALPDGVYRSEASANPLGTPYRFPLALTVAGDRILLDFTGAPPQLGRGGLNCTLNYTEAHATYPLKCMLTPNVRGNAGCYRAFEVKAPERSMLNAAKPAAVNLRTRTGWYLAPNIFRALADAAPDKVQAFTGLPVACNLHGTDAEGKGFSDLLFMGGGQGASRGRDGISGLLYPTSAANTSIEMFEARVPALVLEKAYVTDSGGAGEHRGGLGQRVRLRKRDADAAIIQGAVYPEGANNPFDGLHGGKAGGMARGLIHGPGPGDVHDVGTGELVELTTPDRIIDVTLAGGSGHGDPRKRARAAVERDVALGYVSAAAAREIYGVALAETPTPTHAAE
jgi:5-oxoprolinase (ATP-hydrolysing)